MFLRGPRCEIGCDSTRVSSVVIRELGAWTVPPSSRPVAPPDFNRGVRRFDTRHESAHSRRGALARSSDPPHVKPVAEEASSDGRVTGAVPAGGEAPGSLGGWGGRRLLYFGIGWLFFALGVLGAVLPLLPATPFMLLAAWAFGNSSRRFERWLLEHRWFGNGIKRWRAHRVVPLRVKLVSYTTMLVTFALSATSGRLAWWALAAQAALMAYGAWFLARLPSKVPDSAEPAP